MEHILTLINIITEELYEDSPPDQLFDYQIAFEVIYTCYSGVDGVHTDFEPLGSKSIYSVKDYKKINKIMTDYEFDIKEISKLISKNNRRSFVNEYIEMFRSFNKDFEQRLKLIKS